MKGDSLIDIFSIQYTMEDKGFLRAFFIMNLPKNVFQDINFIFHSNDCSITSELLQNCLSTWTEKKKKNIWNLAQVNMDRTR